MAYTFGHWTGDTFGTPGVTMGEEAPTTITTITVIFPSSPSGTFDTGTFGSGTFDNLGTLDGTAWEVAPPSAISEVSSTLQTTWGVRGITQVFTSLNTTWSFMSSVATSITIEWLVGKSTFISGFINGTSAIESADTEMLRLMSTLVDGTSDTAATLLRQREGQYEGQGTGLSTVSGAVERSREFAPGTIVLGSSDVSGSVTEFIEKWISGISTDANSTVDGTLSISFFIRATGVNGFSQVQTFELLRELALSGTSDGTSDVVSDVYRFRFTDRDINSKATTHGHPSSATSHGHPSTATTSDEVVGTATSEEGLYSVASTRY